MEQAITVSTVSQSKVNRVRLHSDHARDLTDVTCPLCLEYRFLNAETIAALNEPIEGRKAYDSLDDLFADLNSDDD
ncbi:MAG: hypothetical protein QM523_05125 [Candidatus Pacebacteria bacterium]|nr:hypothetical protein [Candidatus Paceibacterota bacterium]